MDLIHILLKLTCEITIKSLFALYLVVLVNGDLNDKILIYFLFAISVPIQQYLSC